MRRYFSTVSYLQKTNIVLNVVAHFALQMFILSVVHVCASKCMSLGVCP